MLYISEYIYLRIVNKFSSVNSMSLSCQTTNDSPPVENKIDTIEHVVSNCKWISGEPIAQGSSYVSRTLYFIKITSIFTSLFSLTSRCNCHIESRKSRRQRLPLELFTVSQNVLWQWRFVDGLQIVRATGAATCRQLHQSQQLRYTDKIIVDLAVIINVQCQ